MMNESLFLRALKRLPTERTPLWIMRQAGRYLPEYRKVRGEAGDFLSLCKNPELACEVTLQPLRRFALDAAIVFSDILTIPDAMGLGLHFIEGEGPRFERPLNTLEAVHAIKVPEIAEDLAYVMDAVRLIRQEMPKNLPLIGFSGSPWTLACYMIEGGSSRDFKKILTFMYKEPEAIQGLLTKLARTAALYLEAQIEAGANALMIFDTWGGILADGLYQSFSLAPMAYIVHYLKEKYPHIPLIVFTKGGSQWLPLMADTGCDALGLDWTCNLTRARAEVGKRVALQGNLDPAVLLTSPVCIREQVARVLEAYGPGSGHIFNLGHGITPDVPPEHVEILVEAVRELSLPYHMD